MQGRIMELVAGDACTRLMYPHIDARPADHDRTEARAYASVCCATASVEAFLRFAVAEAEALIREHLYVVTALIDAFAERGRLTGKEVEQVIHDAIPRELLAREHDRRREMQMRAESAEKFKKTVENA